MFVFINFLPHGLTKLHSCNTVTWENFLGGFNFVRFVTMFFQNIPNCAVRNVNFLGNLAAGAWLTCFYKGTYILIPLDSFFRNRTGFLILVVAFTTLVNAARLLKTIKNIKNCLARWDLLTRLSKYKLPNNFLGTFSFAVP